MYLECFVTLWCNFNIDNFVFWMKSKVKLNSPEVDCIHYERNSDIFDNKVFHLWLSCCWKRIFKGCILSVFIETLSISCLIDSALLLLHFYRIIFNRGWGRRKRSCRSISPTCVPTYHSPMLTTYLSSMLQKRILSFL